MSRQNGDDQRHPLKGNLVSFLKMRIKFSSKCLPPSGHLELWKEQGLLHLVAYLITILTI